MPFLGLTTDEHIHYMAMTKILASGDKLYQTYVDHQPPGVFISGVPFIWLLGNTVLTAKIETMVYTTLFIITVGYIVFVLSESRKNAWFAAAIAAFFGSF